MGETIDGEQSLYTQGSNLFSAQTQSSNQKKNPTSYQRGLPPAPSQGSMGVQECMDLKNHPTHSFPMSGEEMLGEPPRFQEYFQKLMEN